MEKKTKIRNSQAYYKNINFHYKTSPVNTLRFQVLLYQWTMPYIRIFSCFLFSGSVYKVQNYLENSSDNTCFYRRFNWGSNNYVRTNLLEFFMIFFVCVKWLKVGTSNNKWIKQTQHIIGQVYSRKLDIYGKKRFIFVK